MQLSNRVSRRMRLHDLHVFMAVVQAGSMNKAARLLNTTQPAVSRSIADLEHTIGVRLLDRSRQGVEPTVYGGTLLAGGVAMFDELRQAMRNIEFLTNPTVGEVKVSAYDPLIIGALSAALDHLRRKHPGIAIYVKSTVAGEGEFQDLRERKVDLLLGRVVRTEEDIHAEALFQDRLRVVVGPNSKFAQRRKLALRELADEPWVLPPPDSTVGLLIANAFRSRSESFPPKRVIWGVASVACSVLPRGPFLGILTDSLLRFGVNLPKLRVLPIELPVPPSPVGIMTVKDRTSVPAVKLFIDCMREVAKPLATRPRSRSGR
jgi:DNA-binding transcriptional LysR family regulator